MNTEQIFEVFDQMSETDDAIPRMRRFVLDLAVRGKLIQQNSSDESVLTLLKKSEQDNTKNLGKESKLQTSTLVKFHTIPDNWEWVPLGSIFDYDAGTKKISSTLDKSYWLLELEDIEKNTGRLLRRVCVVDRKPTSTKSEFMVGDILYGKLRPYLNKVVVADKCGYSTTEIVSLRPKVPLDSHYCALALRRPDFVEYVTQLGQGTKMPRLRTPDALVAPFPLPPLAEQHRIVKKVDELMKLCDELEASCSKRELTREKLTVSSLKRLTDSDGSAEDFRSHAGFVVDNFKALTINADQISSLKQTILDFLSLDVSVRF